MWTFEYPSSIWFAKGRKENLMQTLYWEFVKWALNGSPDTDIHTHTRIERTAAVLVIHFTTTGRSSCWRRQRRRRRSRSSHSQNARLRKQELLHRDEDVVWELQSLRAAASGNKSCGHSSIDSPGMNSYANWADLILIWKRNNIINICNVWWSKKLLADSTEIIN